MTLQIATSTRNARLDAVETDIGTAPILKIRTGSQPLDCATADSGTVVMSITLSSDFMDVASGGIKSFSDLPGTFTASGTGVGDHFRLYKSDGTTCMMQGSVTLTAAAAISPCQITTWCQALPTRLTPSRWRIITPSAF